jgi:Flp pilus assembly protein TadG
MVEFAVVLPVLVTMVFCMLEFGVILYDQSVITNASRAAARRGVLPVPPNSYRTTSATNDMTGVQGYATSYCYNLISLGSGTQPTCTATAHRYTYTAGTCFTPAGCSYTTAPLTCTTNTGSAAVGDCLTVTVNYAYNGLFLSALLNFASNTENLTASTTMTYE